MSQSREDYIKYMYEHDRQKYLSNKELAQGLQVAPASVSEMMLKLQSEELIEYKPYHGAILTPMGRSMAKELVRKHEIWEYFLHHKLGFTLDEVHEFAEVLEHATPTELANRLAVYIEFPEGE